MNKVVHDVKADFCRIGGGVGTNKVAHDVKADFSILGGLDDHEHGHVEGSGEVNKAHIRFEVFDFIGKAHVGLEVLVLIGKAQIGSEDKKRCDVHEGASTSIIFAGNGKDIGACVGSGPSSSSRRRRQRKSKTTKPQSNHDEPQIVPLFPFPRL